MSQQDMDQDWIGGLSVDDLRYKLRGALNELVLVEDTLAGALGYPRSDSGPDDPNGGGYVTGEHTAVSLAAEAGKALVSVEASRRDWAAEADRLDTALDVIAAHCEDLSAKADATIGEIAGADLAWSAWGRAAQWLRHARNQFPCSLPLCAVHPEADR